MATEPQIPTLTTPGAENAPVSGTARESETFAAAAIGPDALQLGAKPSEKSLRNTIGGKIVHFFAYYGIGLFLNSTLSLGITYGLNPRPKVKEFKEGFVERVSSIFKVSDPAKKEKIRDNTRSGMEILFMFIAGCIVTAIMTPFIVYQEQLAHRINRLLGRDADILPEQLKTKNPPANYDELVQARIDSTVKRRTTAGDLWKARFASMGVVLTGDVLLNTANRALEERGLQSTDMLAWRGGQKLYGFASQSDKLRKGLHKSNEWFRDHGASIDAVRKNMGEHFDRLDSTDRKYAESLPQEARDDRMAFSEQTRIIAKEWGWTVVLARMLDKWANSMHEKRVSRQSRKVVDQLKREGVIPQDYKLPGERSPQEDARWQAPLEQPGAAPVTETEEPHPENGRRWSTSSRENIGYRKPLPAASHTDGVETRRSQSAESAAIGAGA